MSSNNTVIQLYPNQDISRTIGHQLADDAYSTHGGGNGGGGAMLEARVAKLEADVENIKTNLAEARSDIRELNKNYASIKTDVSVLLQKTVEIDTALSKKPTADSLKVWFLTILLFSVAMPVITFLINLYIKKP
ncbi:TPA: hypothetical protein ACIVHZ_005000 [Salmonella enterica subsp. enterica serovar Thompson]